ncbi:MAG: hypothetical protein QXW35_02195 [Candidatus Aenigmatarchaeota archaeon]
MPYKKFFVSILFLTLLLSTSFSFSEKINDIISFPLIIGEFLYKNFGLENLVGRYIETLNEPTRIIVLIIFLIALVFIFIFFIKNLILVVIAFLVLSLIIYLLFQFF